MIDLDLEKERELLKDITEQYFPHPDTCAESHSYNAQRKLVAALEELKETEACLQSINDDRNRMIGDWNNLFFEHEDLKVELKRLREAQGEPWPKEELPDGTVVWVDPKDMQAKPPSPSMPWEEAPLNCWSICGMNHYHVSGERYLYVSMTRFGRCITAEGQGTSVWESLKKLAILNTSTGGE